MTRLWLSLVFVTVITACNRANDRTVCDVAARPHLYVNKVVSIVGRLEDNGVDRAALVDEACPTMIVGVLTTEAAERSSEFEKLRSILKEGLMGTLGKKVVGRFTGRVVMNELSWPRVTLYVDKIEGITFEPAPLTPPK